MLVGKDSPSVAISRTLLMIFIGITQRDMNFYDHLQPEEVRNKISRTVRDFWEDEIRGNYEGGDDCTLFMVLLYSQRWLFPRCLWSLLISKLRFGHHHRLSTIPRVYGLSPVHIRRAPFYSSGCFIHIRLWVPSPTSNLQNYWLSSPSCGYEECPNLSEQYDASRDDWI